MTVSTQPPEGYRVIDANLWNLYVLFSPLPHDGWPETFAKVQPHVLRLRGLERIEDGGESK